MLTKTKKQKTKGGHFSKRRTSIVLMSLCTAFFIMQSISANNAPDLQSAPTEISTEESSVIEQTSSLAIEEELKKKEEVGETFQEKEAINEEVKVDEKDETIVTNTDATAPQNTKNDNETEEELPEIAPKELDNPQRDDPEVNTKVNDLTVPEQDHGQPQIDQNTEAPPEIIADTISQLPQNDTKKASPDPIQEVDIPSEDFSDLPLDNDTIPSQDDFVPEESTDKLADIVISEVFIDEQNDWIELYNQTSVPVDLSEQEYRIERATNSGGNPKYYLTIGNDSHATFPNGTIIAPHGHFLITDVDASDDILLIADALMHKSRGFTLTDHNTIYLATESVGAPQGEHHDDTDIVDYIGYGKAHQYEGMPAQNPHSNESLARVIKSSLLIDTNDNSKDFAIQKTPTPTNSRGDSPDLSDEEEINIDYKNLGIRLNEVFPNPIGNDKKGYEFIEIINTGSDKVDIAQWEIQTISSKGVMKKKKLATIPNLFTDIEKNQIEILPSEKKHIPFALTNSFFSVQLRAPNGDLISKTTYSNAKEGVSWNYHASQWYWAKSTPGKANQENPLTKKYPHLEINEIFPDPSTNAGDNEFIELYNPTNKVVSLQNWSIKDASKTGHYTFKKESIPAKSYFVITRSTFGFALNNTGIETISLIAPNTEKISTISYNDARKGQSFNADQEKWYWTKPTPGAKNAYNPQKMKYPQIIINEVLPNPAGNENIDEYIELYNPNSWDITLEGWALSDSSKTGLYVFPEKTKIKAHQYLVIYRKDFSFALNNSGGETITLLAPNTHPKSSLSYISAREGISYNFTGGAWRWSKHLTPWRKNIFNNLPIITHFDVNQNAYRDVYANFHIKSEDRDHEKLKIRWDFGDGRRSYIWKTRHKYAENGTYRASVRIQDESEEIIRNFRVIVKKYPRTKVSITAILPNPAGNDADGEYIIVENKGNKKIKLRGWSVATGSTEKRLVNHPIRKKITIASQESQKVTRKHAALTLPNKKGFIELRRPDGSTADTVSYERTTSIKDDVLFMKINDQWTWIEPLFALSTAAKALSTVSADKIVANALANENVLSNPHLGSTVLGVQSDRHIPESLRISSSEAFFDKILFYLTTFLHKIRMWLS